MWPKTFSQFSSLLFEHNVQRRFEEIVNNVIRKMMFIIIEIKYFSVPSSTGSSVVESVWNVMTYAQKPDFVFRRNGWVYLNRRGRQFSRLLAADVCASAVLMLDTPRSEVVWEYWLPAPFASFPFTSPPVCHRVPSDFKRTLVCIPLSANYQICRANSRPFVRSYPEIGNTYFAVQLCLRLNTDSYTCSCTQCPLIPKTQVYLLEVEAKRTVIESTISSQCVTFEILWMFPVIIHFYYQLGLAV